MISRLVKRSKSLPRNMGRSKTRETIVAPDFYDIHPQKETTIDSGKPCFDLLVLLVSLSRVLG